MMKKRFMKLVTVVTAMTLCLPVGTPVYADNQPDPAAVLAAQILAEQVADNPALAAEVSLDPAKATAAAQNARAMAVQILAAQAAQAAAATQNTNNQDTKKSEKSKVDSVPVKPAETVAVSPEISEFYRKSVFIGDSLTLGFRNYAMKSETGVHDTNFLCAGSYSLRTALETSSSLHPIYKGKKQPVWESIKSMDVSHVFILFGMNDIAVVGNEQTCKNYESFVNKIKEVKPDVDINIISMTYTLAGASKGRLNNDNIRSFNTQLKAFCRAKGWTYCNIVDRLADANGNLAKSYCSDGFVHQTHAAYAGVWDPYFSNMASKKVGAR